MFAVGTGYHTIHVDDDGLALLGTRGGASCLFDIIVGVFPFLEIDGVWIEHFTIDLDCAVIAGYDNAVAFTQYGIVLRTRILQGFVELDTYGVIGVGHQFFDVDGVTSRVALGST